MIHGKQESYTETLQFIKLFQKRKWLYYIGLLNFLKKENHFIDILKVFFTKSPSFEIEGFEDLYSKLVKVEVEKSDTLDVLIPTLGRKKYLKDVLDDLAKQTHLPKNVIIVEQHPDENMDTELDYIKNESWPFVIKHTFIHKLGACNARNIGLDMIESKWLFMADDDIRITDKTIENTLSFMKSINVPSVSIGTYLPSQDKKALGAQAILWEAYSTCTTILASKYAKQVRFDMAYEFGYGEDTAYGRELRNIGCPTLYTPVNALLHLKAPIGGFRYQFPHPWLKDDIQPKPSPTMMYLYQSYMSKSQLFAYKVFLFLSQSINRKKINIFKYKKQFQKQWERSEYWADEYRKTEK